MTDSFDADLEPVLLAYGKACFAAQSLESSIRLLLVVQSSARAGMAVSPRVLSEIESETMRDAVYSLFERAKAVEYFTAAEEKQIKQAMRTRNYLIHELWARYAARMTTPDGRAFLVGQMEKIQRELGAAERILASLVDRHLEEHGLTLEKIQELALRQYQSGVEVPG
mgnify:CR=1 FL=1